MEQNTENNQVELSKEEETELREYVRQTKKVLKGKSKNELIYLVMDLLVKLHRSNTKK